MMNLEIQWFIYVLIREEVVGLDDALVLWEQMGGETLDIADFAQGVLNMAAGEDSTEEEREETRLQIQEYVDEALEHAENEEIPDFSGFEGTHLAVDENSDEMDSENFDKAKQPQAGGFNPFANFHAVTPDEIRKAAAARPTKPKHPTESLPPPMAKPIPAPPGGKRVPPPPEKTIPSAHESQEMPTAQAVKSIPVAKAEKTVGDIFSDATATGRAIPVAEVFKNIVTTPLENDGVLLDTMDDIPDDSSAIMDELSTINPVRTNSDWQHLELPLFSNIMDRPANELRTDFMQLLDDLRVRNVSDLHIVAGAVPYIRRYLELIPIGGKPLTAEEALKLNTCLLDDVQLGKFTENRALVYAMNCHESRFRAGLMEQHDGISGNYRLHPRRIRSLQELGFLPLGVRTIERLLDYHNGLVLIAGPVGSGKTTTLASVVNILNTKRSEHIVDIERPIEMLHESKSCNVTQREIGVHTANYDKALRAALREDPDIIVVGELRDLQTIENAITAAETGHLVFATLHTANATTAMDRLLEVFPPEQQPQIRGMIASSLRGIICQKLIPSTDGAITSICEILINNLAVANIIAEGKTHQLPAAMQAGIKVGMCSFDQNLLAKFRAGRVSKYTASEYVTDPVVINLLKQEIALREARSERTESSRRTGLAGEGRR